MKPSVLLLPTALAACAAAQQKQDYFPVCSIDCLDKATEEATDCSTTDAVCICVQANYEAIYNSGVNCVLQACGPDEAIGTFPDRPPACFKSVLPTNTPPPLLFHMF